MAATLINGDHILALKAKLQLFNSATIGAGATDPTSVALLGAAGDVYISTSTKRVYQKQDAGTSTNWSPLDASFSVGVFGSTPNTAGASVSGDVLTLQPANATNPGGVSTTTQSFAGNKTFTGSIGASNFSGTSSGTNTGDQTITLTGGVTGSGTSSFAATVVTNANLTGPITSVGNATAVAAQTGTGSTFVMNTSPTLVTPNLGTPTTLVGTNITGTAAGLTAGAVTTNANLTGVITSSGNTTSITSQTGTGTKFVVDTSPTIATATFTGATTFPGSASINGSGMVIGNVFISTSSNSASTGILRMSSADAGVVFRNNANSGDVALTKNTSDALVWNGTAVLSSAGVLLAAAHPALTGDITNSAGSLATTAAATQANIATLSRAAGVAVHGTNTNDSASAGFVGEYIASTVSNTSVGTSAAWFDGTSISLTAGDWELTAITDITPNGGTNTINSLGISTTTGNSTSGLSVGDNRIDLYPATAVYDSAGSIPGYRMSLSATTTVYLKLLSVYSVATPKYNCRLSARRMR